MYKIFAQNLSKKRHDSGKSQKQVASDLGISQALLSHYENGIREPNLEFVVRIAEYYHCTTDDLLGVQYPARQVDDGGERHPYAAQMEQGVRESLDLLIKSMKLVHDEGATCYGIMYLAGAMYEIIRGYAMLVPNYDREWFALSDENFMTGAVGLDMAWLRIHFVQALNSLKEGNTVKKEELDALGKLMSSATTSMYRSIVLTDQRIARISGDSIDLKSMEIPVFDFRKYEENNL